ncbi:MAG: periplasmic heavy metal sensor [Deltaproteobacteria bacterium]|jgi:Spy/CpxP family protein refolding chaperone|nr:periplasmic heavy metal sensor [Deltaproteobacteria bacterium]
MRKTPLLAAWGLILALFFAAPLLAQPPQDADDDDYDDSPPRLTLTDEQRATFDKLWDAYSDQIFPIKEQLRDQRLLYVILARQTAVNLDEVKKTIAEMSRLRAALRTQAKKFQADVKAAGLPEELGDHAEEAPPDDFPGHGFGGPGWGHGRGHHGWR